MPQVIVLTHCTSIFKNRFYVVFPESIETYSLFTNITYSFWYRKTIIKRFQKAKLDSYNVSETVLIKIFVVF